jgi:hypothetical protein
MPSPDPVADVVTSYGTDSGRGNDGEPRVSRPNQTALDNEGGLLWHRQSRYCPARLRRGWAGYPQEAISWPRSDTCAPVSSGVLRIGNHATPTGTSVVGPPDHGQCALPVPTDVVRFLLTTGSLVSHSLAYTCCVIANLEKATWMMRTHLGPVPEVDMNHIHVGHLRRLLCPKACAGNTRSARSG